MSITINVTTICLFGYTINVLVVENGIKVNFVGFHNRIWPIIIPYAWSHDHTLNRNLRKLGLGKSTEIVPGICVRNVEIVKSSLIAPKV